jgi:Zn-dependent M32 family carboxypeptidase
MEHLLKDQGLDPLLINIVTRGVSDRTQAETSIFVNLFNAISAYQEQIRTFLAEMKEQEGEWDIDLNTQLIQFTTSAARDKYVLGSNLVANSAGMVQQAFQAWANYKPSK